MSFLELPIELVASGLDTNLELLVKFLANGLDTGLKLRSIALLHTLLQGH